MKTLGKYWKLILALVMLLAAALVLFLIYRPGKQAYEQTRDTLNSGIFLMQAAIVENARYADIQEQLPAAEEAVNASRLELYQHLPAELREEDQLIYLLELEEQFEAGSDGQLGFTSELYQHFLTELNVKISFEFGTTAPLAVLSDGSILVGQTITVYFTGGYENVKSMIEYLATDSRITSIQFASMEYNQVDGSLTGSFTLLCYLLDSDLLEYQEPDVTVPDTGKSDIFD